MNELQVFKNEKFGRIRTLEIENKICFVGKDIAEALNYKETHKAILKHVDEDDRIKHPVIDDLGREQLSWVINESGLYSLILSSKMKEAKIFKSWVTSEVLPSIKNHGAYITSEKIEEILNNPDTIIRLATNLKEEQEKIRGLEYELKKNEPKINYYDRVLNSKDTKTATELGQEFGMTAYKLNKFLISMGVLSERYGKIYINGAFVDKGYHDIKKYPYKNSHGIEKVNEYLVWTQRGKEFIYGLLKKNLMIS